MFYPGGTTTAEATEKQTLETKTNAGNEDFLIKICSSYQNIYLETFGWASLPTSFR